MSCSIFSAMMAAALPVTAVTSQTPQMVCSVLLGAKLLWSVVVGAAAVPKSNPSQSFFWVLLLGYLPGCAKMEIAEESTVC